MRHQGQGKNPVPTVLGLIFLITAEISFVFLKGEIADEQGSSRTQDFSIPGPPWILSTPISTGPRWVSRRDSTMWRRCRPGPTPYWPAPTAQDRVGLLQTDSHCYHQEDQGKGHEPQEQGQHELEPLVVGNAGKAEHAHEDA